MTRPLEGRSVLVTGAASGIGRAIAEAAAQRGARLLLLDVSAAPLAALAEQLGAESQLLDVADEAAWAAISRRAGAWDHVFLNAGIMSAPPDAPFHAANLLTMPLERYRKIVSVNVDGVVLGLRALVPRMRDSGGSIVVTASAAGLIPYPLDPAYSLTKHALVGLVRSLAPTLPPALRLCAICPGGVHTALVPLALRQAVPMMDPSVLAEEALALCLHGKNGEVRVKLRADEPAQSFDPPRIDLL